MPPRSGTLKDKANLAHNSRSDQPATPQAGPSIAGPSSGEDEADPNLSGLALLTKWREGYDRLAELSGNDQLKGHRSRAELSTSGASRADTGATSMRLSRLNANEEILNWIRGGKVVLHQGRMYMINKVLDQMRGKFYMKAYELNRKRLKLERIGRKIARTKMEGESLLKLCLGVMLMEKTKADEQGYR